MPPPGIKKRLTYPTADQVTKVLDACDNPRDRALIMLMVDSGLWRSEVIAVNWDDVDIKTGVINVRKGKWVSPGAWLLVLRPGGRC